MNILTAESFYACIYQMILDVFLYALSHESVNATGLQGIIEYILHYNGIKTLIFIQSQININSNERNSHVSTFS